MDAKETPPTGEIRSPERTLSGDGDVVVMISGEEGANQVPDNRDGKGPPPKPPAESSSQPPKIASVSWSAPELPSPHGKHPRVPVPNEALLRRRTIARSAFSRPKSRFGEQPVPIDPNVLEDHNHVPHVTFQEQFSPTSRRFSRRHSSINLSGSIRTMSMATASPGRVGLDEAEQIYRKVSEHKEKRNGVTCVFVFELVALLSLVVLLAASLTIPELEDRELWGLEIWKWCVLLLVTLCGLLVIKWFMSVVVFLIEKNYLLKNKVLYFVYGLKQSVQVFIWLCLILSTWVLLFDHEGRRSRFASRVHHYITWTLASIMIGSVLWLVKTTLIKILASNFQLNRFFERTQESIFHHYVMHTLSGPALIEEARRVGRTPSIGQFSLNNTRKGTGGNAKKEKKKVVMDLYQLHKMKKGKVSSWDMKTLVDAVTSSGLSMSDTLQNFDDGAQHEITNEMEATAAAYHIFKNVAQPGAKYIEEDDLMRFMIKEEVDVVFPMFEGAETGRIDLKSLVNWVVKVYQGRKALAHALTDTKTAVLQLNRLVSVILVILTITIWVLVTEIATKVLYFLGTQILAAAFIFKNMCKTVFEAIIFVFVMHPYDVGDRCVIDGVPLLVEEMNLLSTVFLKLNNEKVYYPNAVLATKAISNYYRSSDMGDMIPFSISFSTPLEKIGSLKERIQKFFVDNPHHWYPTHNLVVNDIENVNKITINLFCVHTMNFQDLPEKNRRRTELVIGLKTIFEDLGINYELLPQDVRLMQIQNNL